MDGVGTTRLETFSDGVFAIAATLLVLEITIPNPLHGSLGSELLHLWPSYLAYATSFITIGIIWVNHHSIFELVERADRRLLFINTFFLLDIAFIPFPTKLVAHYLQKPGERSAVFGYAGTLLVMAVVYNIWWRYARGKFAAERYPFAPALKPIRETLAKLDPKPVAEPPAPKKPYVPSLVLQRKNKRRR